MVEYTEPPRCTPCTPTELHPYIYHFLVDNQLLKTAKHFKKETGAQDFNRPNGLDIVEILGRHLCAPTPKVGGEDVTTYNTVPPPNFDEPIVAEETKDDTKKSKKKKRKHDESLNEAEDVVKSKKKKKTKDDVVNEVECNVTTINDGGLVSEEVAVEKTSLLSKVLKKKKKKQKYTITNAPETTPELETTTVSTDIVPAETPTTEAVAEVVTENQTEESTDINAEKPKKKKKKSKKSIEESAPLVEAVVVEADNVVTNDEKMETDENTEPITPAVSVEPEVESKSEEKVKKKKKKKSKSEDSQTASPTTTTEAVDELSTTMEEAVETETTKDTEEATEVEDDKEEAPSSGEEVKTTADESEEVPKSKKLKKNESFRRVVAEDIYVPNQLADNSFDAKIGSRGDWGEKANNDLRHTKGKSFRHEKTKKKRGSYRGGNINTSINSIKFDDDE